ncbi:MAG: hypothetical protein APR63_03195 [Desulfuromonas sp. SDB]|nr:MAG: hypothetical protein APR63_03195 [Desulfuromonas sp. SDB]
MIQMHFNFKDIFRAGRLGFSFKKISASLIGLVIITLIYNIFTYLALIVSGISFTEIWQFMRLLPIPLGISLPWYSWLIWAGGVVLSLLTLAVTVGAISKITFEQLRGDEFYEVSKAYKDALKLWKSAFLSPVFLAIFIIFLLLVGVVFGQIGKIPVAGPWIVGLFSIFLILGAFFIVYLCLIFVVSVFMSPTIALTTKGDSFDTLFEVFSVANDQPWRWVIWQILVGIIALVGTALYSFALKYTFMLIKWAMQIPQGQEWWSKMWMLARGTLPAVPPQLDPWVSRIFPGAGWIQPMGGEISLGPLVGGILLAIALYLVVLSILALKLSIFSAGQTLIYVVLVKIKDDRNLLETKKKWSLDDEDLEDEEFEEETEDEQTEDDEDSSGEQDTEEKPETEE